MNMPKKDLLVEYMCTYCGTLITRAESEGRPMPGVCHRRNKPGSMGLKPHRWIVRRKMEKLQDRFAHLFGN